MIKNFLKWLVNYFSIKTIDESELNNKPAPVSSPPVKPKLVKKPAKKPKKPKLNAHPHWLDEIKRFSYLKELTGKNDHPLLDKWWARFKLLWLKGQAWCGLAMAVTFENVGYEAPDQMYRAKSWLNFGVAIDEPCHGAVVVLKTKYGHHVAIVESMTPDGKLICWGGNQSNALNQRVFSTDNVLGYRVPADYDVAKNVLKVAGDIFKSSTNTA